MKWLEKTILGVFMIPPAVLIVAFVLVSTQSGSRILLGIAAEWSNGQLALDQIRGTLFKRIELKGLTIRQAGAQQPFLTADRLELKWDPRSLLRGKLRIEDLQIDSPEIYVPETKQTQSRANRVPAIHSPINVELERLRIERLKLHEGGKLIGPASLEASATLHDNKIFVNSAILNSPKGEIQLSGELNLRDSLSFKAHTHWQIILQTDQRLAGQGELTGDLSKIQFTQTLEAPEKLKLRGAIALSAQTPQINLIASWEKLIFPPAKDASAAQYELSNGQLNLDGDLDHFKYEIQSQISGQAIPGATLHSQGNGSSQYLNIQSLDLGILDGTVQGHGKVSWESALQIEAELSARHINPGAKWTSWTGDVNLDAQIKAGGQSLNDLQGVYEITNLQGSLREQSITGNTKINQMGSKLLVSQLRLNAGATHLNADGQLLPALGLNARLSVPDLQQWNTNMKGSLDMTMALHGTYQQPDMNIEAQLNTPQLSNQPETLRLHATAKADLTADKPNARADIKFGVDGYAEDHLQAHVELSTPTPSAWPANAQLSGTLKGHLQAGPFLKRWIPDAPKTEAGLNINLQLDGTPVQPLIRGQVNLNEPVIMVPSLGITLKDLQLRLQSNNQHTAINLDGSVKSGAGKLFLTGKLTPDAELGWPATLKITGSNVKAVNLPEAQAEISPDIEIITDKKSISIRGRLDIPQSIISAPHNSGSMISVSSDVHVVGNSPPEKRDLTINRSIDTQLSITVGTPGQIPPKACTDPNLPAPPYCPGLTFHGYGLNALMAGQLRLTATDLHTPEVQGRLQVLGGNFEKFGTAVQLTKGYLLFAGDPADPRLNVTAERRIRNVTVRLNLTGTANSPQTQFFSDPPMGQEETLSYLFFGHGLQETNGAASNNLAQASGLSLGADLLSKSLSESLGADITVGSDLNGSATVGMGKYLTPDLYLGYGLDLYDQSAVLRIIYQLSRHLSLQAQGGLTSGIDLDYRIQWN